MCVPFTAESYEAAFANDFLGGESAAKAEPGTKVGDHEWKILKSDAEGIFPLNSLSRIVNRHFKGKFTNVWKG